MWGMWAEHVCGGYRQSVMIANLLLIWRIFNTAGFAVGDSTCEACEMWHMCMMMWHMCMMMWHMDTAGFAVGDSTCEACERGKFAEGFGSLLCLECPSDHFTSYLASWGKYLLPPRGVNIFYLLISFTSYLASWGKYLLPPRGVNIFYLLISFTSYLASWGKYLIV